MNIFNRKNETFNVSDFGSKLLLTLFFTSIVLIPFDDLPYLKALGGLGRRASIYSFLIIVPITFIVFIKSKRIFYKNCLENNLMLCFYSSCIIGILFNISRISESLFKGQTGIKRVIIQMLSITLLILSMYSIQFILKNSRISLKVIRRYICLSFIPVAILGIIQLINILKIHDFSYIIDTTSYFVNASLRGIPYGPRVRSICAEASYLGMYCAFVFPWFFSYIITEKNTKIKIFHVTICVIILSLVVATKSRTAIILSLLALSMMEVLILLFYKNNKIKILSTIVIGLMTIFLFGFSSSLDTIIKKIESSQIEQTGNPTNIVNNYGVGDLISSISNPNIDSNIARNSMQNAAFNMGLDNPILGTGIGQFGFFINDYVNKDSLVSHEVRIWTDDTNSVWPPVHSIYHRIFAEGGIVGLLLYISFAISICLKLFIKIIKNKNDLFGIILLASYCCILVGGLTLDQYVVPQFWIMSAILIAYNNNLIETPILKK